MERKTIFTTTGRSCQRRGCLPVLTCRGDLTIVFTERSEGRRAMKGNAQVLKVLNEVLKKELTGINQYFLHAKMCKNWGYEVLYEAIWQESIGEMKHADEVTERILFLEGIPNMAGYDKILIGSTGKQQLEKDLALEQAAVEIFKAGIKTFLETGDNATRELLGDITGGEDGHLDRAEGRSHRMGE